VPACFSGGNIRLTDTRLAGDQTFAVVWLRSKTNVLIKPEAVGVEKVVGLFIKEHLSVWPRSQWTVPQLSIIIIYNST